MPILPSPDDLGTRNPRAARGSPQYRISPVGNAVQGLGQALGSLGATASLYGDRALAEQKAAKEEADKTEAFGVQSRYLAFDDQWSKSFVDRARDAPAGAANFNEGLQKDYTTSAKEFLGTVPDTLKAEYDQKLFGLESRLTDAGQKFQTQEGDRYQAEQIELGQNPLLDRARKSPAEWKGAAAEGEQHILNSSLPQNVKDAKILEWRQRLAKGLVETQAETNPGAASGLLGVSPAPLASAASPPNQQAALRSVVSYAQEAATVIDPLTGDKVAVPAMTPVQAYTWAGNVQQESSGNPNALNRKEGAFGSIQWREGRQANLKAFARANGLPVNDLRTQTLFGRWELTHTEAGAGAHFLAATTPEAANRALKGYIRYGDNSEGTRLQNAIRIAGGKDMNVGQGPTIANAAQLPAAAPSMAPADAALAQFIQTNIPYEDRVKTYNQITAADQKQFAQQATDYSEFLRSGNTPTPEQQQQFSQPVLQQRLGADVGQKVYEQLQQDAAYGADVASLKFAGPAETQQIFSDRKALLSSPLEYRENAQNLAGLSEIVTKRDAAITADPALYVKQSEPVDTAYNAMQTAMRDPTAAPAVKQAAISNYADATTAMQAHLGIAPENQRILPKAEAAGIAGQFNNLTAKPGESGGQNAAQLMRGLQATWGNHYPEIFKQLAKDGNLPGIALVVGAMDMPSQQPAAEQLAEAAANGGRKVYVDLLTGNQKTELTDALVEELMPFSKTLASQSGGANTVSAFHDGVELLAMAYITQGTDDAATAASRAYEEVIGKKYQIQDSYRVPQPWDVGIIAAGADIAMAELSGPLKVDQYGYAGPDGGPGLALQEADLWQQHADSVRGFGFWLTNPDETGLDLYDAGRRIVQRADGTPITFTWEELNKKAAEVATVQTPLGRGISAPGVMTPFGRSK